ncbi:MAG: FKBP-type peptidyl-prolyl cis-trans isomerase [Oscillospiraceae bacterium]|nr:FKBP-type peptidyl-prolyl cis-trans isomerase [Oscillospiraceae bacterium]
MKKAIVTIVILALLALTLTGCAGENSPKDSTGGAAQAGQQGSGEEQPLPTEGAQTTEGPSGGEAGEYVPDYSFYSAGLTDEGFFEGVTASDIMELPAYKGIDIPAAAVRVDPEDMEGFLRSQILAPYAETVKVTDRPVENFDTVNIDYTGYMDEIAFDGGSTMGMGTDVTIGVTSYIDDFLEQLIGHSPGENFDIFVTFPDRYPNNPDLAGREARFNITINYISESSEVELTDEIARDYGFEDKAGLLERVEDLLLNDARATFISELLAQATCREIPASVTAYFENYLVGYFSLSYGMDLSDSRQEILEGNEETVRVMAISYLTVQAICEKEGLRAGESDMDAIGILPYLDVYGLPYAKQSALTELVVPEFIIANGSPTP